MAIKATIIGCGYVGKEVARLWQHQGLTVTATTTSPGRVEELQTVADRVQVLRGTDPGAVQDCLLDQQVVLVSVGSKRGANYEETYLGYGKDIGGGIAEYPGPASYLYEYLFCLWSTPWSSGDQKRRR